MQVIGNSGTALSRLGTALPRWKCQDLDVAATQVQLWYKKPLFTTKRPWQVMLFACVAQSSHPRCKRSISGHKPDHLCQMMWYSGDVFPDCQTLLIWTTPGYSTMTKNDHLDPDITGIRHCLAVEPLVKIKGLARTSIWPDLTQPAFCIHAFMPAMWPHMLLRTDHCMLQKWLETEKTSLVLWKWLKGDTK